MKNWSPSTLTCARRVAAAYASEHQALCAWVEAAFDAIAAEVLENMEDATVKHNRVTATMVAAGWTWGAKPDLAKKRHPFMVKPCNLPRHAVELNAIIRAALIGTEQRLRELA